MANVLFKYSLSPHSLFVKLLVVPTNVDGVCPPNSKQKAINKPIKNTSEYDKTATLVNKIYFYLKPSLLYLAFS